jgi:hypothetical protein
MELIIRQSPLTVKNTSSSRLNKSLRTFGIVIRPLSSISALHHSIALPSISLKLAKSRPEENLTWAKTYYLKCIVASMDMIAVIGAGQNSGKTTAVEALVSEFTKRGLKVGTVKQIHEQNFSIDKKGKDTWRHSRAGAEIVVAASPNQVVVKTWTCW